jgi:hypothetical protein
VRRVLAALVKADLSALILNNCGDNSPQTKAVTSDTVGELKFFAA